MTNKEAIRRILDHKRVHSLNEPRAVLINEALDLAIKALEEKPQGEWTIKYINGCSFYICSVCKEMHIDKGNFCPNCGADMKGGAE